MIGVGKVGFGVAAGCVAAGAAVTVIDEKAVTVPANASRADAGDQQAVDHAFASA